MTLTSNENAARKHGRARSHLRFPAAEAREAGGGATPDPGKDLKSLPLADVQEATGVLA